MEIKVPKNKWDLKSVVYSTAVKCPRCGLETYVSLSEWGPKWKEWLREEDRDWVQTSCDRCGKIIVVYRDKEDDYPESFKTTIKLGNVYKIKAKDEKSIYNYISYGYIEQYRPFSYFGDVSVPEEWYRIILLTKPTQEDGVIVHCGNFENCVGYFEASFEILEDTGILNHYPDVFINEEKADDEDKGFFIIGSNTWYDVKAKESEPLDKEYLNAVAACIQQLGESDAYNLVLHLENRWNYITVHCASFAICKEVLEENFHIFHISEDQDIPLKSEKEDYK